MHQTLFLSTVTSEFGELRLRFAKLLGRTKRFHVRHQVDFVNRGVTTLKMLEAEVAASDAIIHVIGMEAGWRPPLNQVSEFLIRNPEFAALFPQVSSVATDGEVSATQWEVWLALYHQITTKMDTKIIVFEFPARLQTSGSQKQHAERVRNFGLHPKQVADDDALYDEMLLSMIEIGIIPPEEIRSLSGARIAMSSDTAVLRFHDSATMPFKQVPSPPRDLIGRYEELSELKRRLKGTGTKWTTISGAGGVGKTATCLKLAADISIEQKMHRILYVDLAQQRSMTDVVGQIQEAAFPNSAIAETHSKLLTLNGNQLAREIAAKVTQRMPDILILDNCEQVAEEIRLIGIEFERLQIPYPILATSRIPIGLDCEQLLRLEPLQNGLDRIGESSHDSLLELDAVKLFLNEVRQIHYKFSPSHADLREIAKAAKLVGGLPLGIKLIARHCSATGSDGMVANFATLNNFRRPTSPFSPDCHSGLDTAFRWSINKCSSEQLLTLELVSIFPSGVGLAEFEYLQAYLIRATNWKLLLNSLYSEGLLEIQRSEEGKPRYHVLEPIRQILTNASRTIREEDAFKCMANFLLREFQTLNRDVSSSRAPAILKEVENMEDNVLRAIEVCAKCESQIAYTLCNLFGGYMDLRISPQIRIQLIDAITNEHTTNAQFTPLLLQKIRSLNAIGQRNVANELASDHLCQLKECGSYDVIELMLERFRCLYLLDEYEKAQVELDSIVAVIAEISNHEPKRQFAAISDLCAAELMDRVGRFSEAIRYSQKAIDAFSLLDNQRLLARAFNRLGLANWHHGDLRSGVKNLSRAARINGRVLSDRLWFAGNWTNLGLLETDLGRFDSAISRFALADKLHDSVGNHHWRTINQFGWGKARFWRGRLRLPISRGEMLEGKRKLYESIDQLERYRDFESAAQCRGELGRAFLESGNPEDAIPMLEQAVLYRSTNPNARELQYRVSLADSYFQLQRLGDAIKLVEEVSLLSPNFGGFDKTTHSGKHTASRFEWLKKELIGRKGNLQGKWHE